MEYIILKNADDNVPVIIIKDDNEDEWYEVYDPEQIAAELCAIRGVNSLSLDEQNALQVAEKLMFCIAELVSFDRDAASSDTYGHIFTLNVNSPDEKE